jgi:MurNAc alpha-1-phosphate uridylyltransferase
MKAMLLAAGRGQRLAPLTDTLAKPLIEVGGQPLIVHQIRALARAGVREIVVNTAHLAEQIEAHLGDGSRWNVRLAFSREGTQAGDALETLGGIVKALPLLGDEPFVLASSDILCDFDYAGLAAATRRIAAREIDAHLVMVPNPPWHARGDFAVTPAAAGTGGLSVQAQGLSQGPRMTYANIAVLHPRSLHGLQPVRARLFPWLVDTAEPGRIGAECFTGYWANVGTPEELAQAREHFERRRAARLAAVQAARPPNPKSAPSR